MAGLVRHLSAPLRQTPRIPAQIRADARPGRWGSRCCELTAVYDQDLAGHVGRGVAGQETRRGPPFPRAGPVCGVAGGQLVADLPAAYTAVTSSSRRQVGIIPRSARSAARQVTQELGGVIRDRD